MNALRALIDLRHPLAALAICALLAQQLVGVVLNASPAMALESGFSLCLSGPPSADEDPLSIVDGAGFCPCTITGLAGILPAASLIAEPVWQNRQNVLPTPAFIGISLLRTGPPPARAPPLTLHS